MILVMFHTWRRSWGQVEGWGWRRSWWPLPLGIAHLHQDHEEGDCDHHHVHGGIYNLQGCKLVITFTGILELMNDNDIISTFTSLGFHKRSRYGLSVDLRMLNHLWSFLLPWSLIPIITHRCSLYIVSVAGWESTAFQPNLLSFWQLMQLNVPFLQQILSFDFSRKDDEKQIVEICSDGN